MEAIFKSEGDGKGDEDEGRDGDEDKGEAIEEAVNNFGEGILVEVEPGMVG